MSELDPRSILEEYVKEAKVFHLATIGEEGDAWMSPVWFAVDFAPDRLYFISRASRQHCKNLEFHAQVTGSIVHHDPVELGDPVRGVMLSGRATPVPPDAQHDARLVYTKRWPRAVPMLDADDPARRNDLYQIEVESWRLHDELNFPKSPRHAVEPQ